MVCPECGQPVTGEMQNCPHCGHVLRVSGLRVRRGRGGGDMATAKRTALTPTHPRLAQVAAPTLDETADPWRSEWLATAKRSLPADAGDTAGARRYLVPGVIAAILLIACMGLVLVLHGTSSKVPALTPAAATATIAATSTDAATATTAATATVAGYTPPRHPPTATPIPAATATVDVATPTPPATATPLETPTATTTPTKTPTATATKTH